MLNGDWGSWRLLGYGKFKTFVDYDDIGFFIDMKPFFVLLRVITDFGAGRDLHILVDDRHVDFAVGKALEILLMTNLVQPFLDGVHGRIRKRFPRFRTSF